MTKFKLKLSLSDLMFFIPYTLYFLSFFLEDLPLEGSWFTIIKLIRYLSYALFMLDGVVISRNVLNLKAVSILALLAVYVGIMLFTKDTYFLSLAVIVYTAQKVKIKKVFKVSYYLLIVFTAAVLLLVAAGVLENTNLILNGRSRYTLGFYHSNVFPLIVFYIFAYRLIMGRVKKYEFILWIAAAVMVFRVCNSRSGIIGMAAVIGLYLFFSVFNFNYKNFFIKFVFKYSFLWLSIFNFAMIILLPKRIRSVYMLNQMFTGRFALSYLKMRDLGFHFISLLPGSAFSSSRYVIDSGYSYVLLKYGLLFTLFYVVLQAKLFNKYKHRKEIIFVYFGVTLTNFIDNDLFSYGFIPFILLAFSNDYKTDIKAILAKLKIPGLKRLKLN